MVKLNLSCFNVKVRIMGLFFNVSASFQEMIYIEP